MLDPFTGNPTCLRGRALPDGTGRTALQDDHERRLEAFARLRALAAECGVATDPDRDLVTLPEDAISLLELGDPLWARLGEAIREWRLLVPLRTLDSFGFPPESTLNLEGTNPRLRYLHSGVEASAFVAPGDHSVYKFYRPAEGTEKLVGSTFAFRRGEERTFQAEARPGNYQALFEKLGIIDALGMATEVVAVTPEGIVVAKQALGDPLEQNEEMSGRLPKGLIPVHAIFLRADRDHPRLFFWRDQPYLVADLHARNFVRGADGGLHVIDLVAAPWPQAGAVGEKLINDWLERVRLDPGAPALPGANDDEL